MGARRATVAVLAVLAAGGPVALAQSDGADGRAKAADPARLRAEGLADAATRRFSEVMKEEGAAQGKPAAPSLEDSHGDASVDAGAALAGPFQQSVPVDHAQARARR